MTSPTLDIRLLGGLEIARDGSVLALPSSRKSRALLAYLVATARPHPRDRLCDLLWDGPADPRAALRWSLTKIRPLVDDANARRVVADNDQVGFEPHGARVDVHAITEALQPGVAALSIDTLETIGGWFSGDFLDGLDIPECYGYSAWWAAEREAARALHRSVLTALVERLADRPDDALAHARALVLTDPLAQDAHAAIVRLLGRLGRTREALQHYEQCRHMLGRELGVAPDSVLEAARRELRMRSTPQRTRAPAPLERATAACAPELPPLVGRQAEVAVFDGLIEQARQNRVSHVLLISGEPGIGKTRLLEELAARVRAAGGQVLAGRAFEAEMMRAYGPWIDALKASPLDTIPEELLAPLRPLLPEHAHAEPHGRAPGPDAPQTPRRATHSLRDQLFDAITRVVRSLLHEHAPNALVLDDAQWLDEASAALLHFIARGVHGGNVIIACSTRSGDTADNTQVTRMITAMRRGDRLREIELAPLSAEETAALTHRVDPQIDAARIFAESEGNPLFALEIAAALRQGDAPLSGTVESLIRDRLDQLDNDARELVPWAAALGHGFSLDLLGRVTERSAADLLRSVEALESRGVIRASAARPENYDFTHDLVRRAAYGRLSEPRRRLVHLRIAHTLAAQEDPGSLLAGDIAHHAAAGGDHELAVRACIAAGERCLHIFAHEQAAELALRGLAHFSRIGSARPVHRLALQVALLKILVYSDAGRSRVPSLETELKRAVQEAESAGVYTHARMGLYLLSQLHYTKGDLAAAYEDTLLAEQAGRLADPRTAARAIADTAQCLAMIEREMPRAQALAEEASAIADEIGAELPEIPMALGLISHHHGELERAIGLLETALTWVRRDQDRWWECTCLARLVMIELERGHAAGARKRCVDLLHVAERMAEGSDAPFAAALAALAGMALGEADAIAAVDLALERLRIVDSKWMTAYVQNHAAALDLEAGRTAAARARAHEALRAATTVDRASDIVLARALLLRIAWAEGDRAAAAEHESELQRADAGPKVLNARALAASTALADPARV